MCSFHLYRSSLQWPQTASVGAETVISVAKLFHSCIVCQTDPLFALFERKVYTGSLLSATRQADQQWQPCGIVHISGKTHAVHGKWSDTKMKACDLVWWVGDHGPWITVWPVEMDSVAVVYATDMFSLKGKGNFYFIPRNKCRTD